MKRKMRKMLAGCLAFGVLMTSAGSAFAQGSGGQSEISVLPETDGTVNGQPNYIYRAMGTTASDPQFAQQWGLYNDGTFEMEEKANAYPVFDDPFETPWDQGQWQLVIKWGDTSSAAARTASASTRTVTSKEGVDINVKDAWDRFNTNGNGVIVAMIDTGVDYTNEQLADSIWINEGEIAGDGVDNDGNGYVDDVYGWNFYDNNNKVYNGEEDNHGTHGTGTIAAKRDDEGTAGIAGNSNVKVMILKALGGEDGAGTTESILAAIKYAEANGASICNLSLGTTGNDQTLKKAMADSDMLFVAAAGNGSDWTGTGQNTDRTPTYPAAWNLDNLISVANLQPDGTLHYSSNYGANTIDIAAPGSYILSTAVDGEYSYMTGTSMAAPMVTGVAAMLYSQYGDMTAKEARNILLTSASSMDSLSGKVRTGGMLDAGAALALNRAEAKDFSLSSGTTGTNNSTSGTTPQTGQKPTAPSPGTPPQSRVGDGNANNGDANNGSGGDKTTVGKGSAPVIRTSTSTGFGFDANNYLTVKVTDPDGDLKAVRYAEGNRDASWFKSGRNGTPFHLDRSGSGTFAYTDSGTYTFYAVDSKGNESTSIVTLQERSSSFSDDFSDMFDWMLRW